MARQKEFEGAGRGRLRGRRAATASAPRNTCENNDVEKAAVRAAPRSRAEAEEMEAAEAAGKKRAKGEDPALRRRSTRALTAN